MGIPQCTVYPLNQVIENVVGLSLNWYMHQKLKTPTGMNGLFINLGNDNVYFSTVRSMARFGLLMLNGGNWEETTKRDRYFIL